MKYLELINEGRTVVTGNRADAFAQALVRRAAKDDIGVAVEPIPAGYRLHVRDASTGTVVARWGDK